jgi:hypothetical protein
MRVEIQIYKDDGTLVTSATEDALQPSNWKTLPDKPVAEGDWRFFGWTFQPMVLKAGKAGGF